MRPSRRTTQTRSFQVIHIRTVILCHSSKRLGFQIRTPCISFQNDRYLSYNPKAMINDHETFKITSITVLLCHALE